MAESTYYIGLMSGTSLDGVDTVLVDFSYKAPKILATHSHQISQTLQTSLVKITKPSWTGSLLDIGTLHQKLGKLFADAVNQLLQETNFSARQIKAIGSHGQTVWHQPLGEHPFSLQLGDANLIAELTGITTIADFRSRDIAAGGQGAPLVPAFHGCALTHPNKNRVILNIGGIANISYLPSFESKDEVLGFDTGPGNGLMDAWISKRKGSSYDKNGEWANSGSILPEALNTLLEDSYFKLSAPKSTGKEAFNLEWLEEKLGNLLDKHKPEDIQATLAELTARTISDNIDACCHELFICGGGIHNQFLMERLQKMLPNITIASTQELGIDPDWMEAIAFAWLAKQTIERNPSNLPVTTGAKGFRILGATYPA